MNGMKLIKKQKVNASATDSLANLSVIGIFQNVEDTVTELFGALGIDNITMKEKCNAIWVFTKTRTEKFKDIAWNEDFETVCFISSFTRAAVCVDIAARDTAGNLCSYSRVELRALDLETGKIRKTTTLSIDDKIQAEEPEADIEFSRFSTAELHEIGQVRVKYTCIDLSRHTNNIEYIRFILDTYSVCELETAPIKEIEVAFANQSFENDILSMQKCCLEGKDIFVMRKDNTVIVKSEIVFREKL